MARQRSRTQAGPPKCAAVVNLPRPTSPDLQTDSDDDATSSDSEHDIPSVEGRNGTPFARRDAGAKTYDDSPRSHDDDLVQAVQERVRIHSLLYDHLSSTTTNKKQIKSATAPPPPISRAHLRLALATLQARQFLASRSFSHLSTALHEISKTLLLLGGPTTLAKSMLEQRPTRPARVETTATGKPNFGVFIPILARLVSDIRSTLSAEEVVRKEFRRSELSRDEAKALVALRQRWVVKPSSSAVAVGGRSTVGGKSTGRGGKRDQKDMEWVQVVEKLVAEHPPPTCIQPYPNTDNALEQDRKTASLLTSIEQLVLPAALPRISLSNLGLNEHDLADWPVLEGLEDVVGWYLSFGYKPERQGKGEGEDEGEDEGGEKEKVKAKVKAREILDGVKVLDLSHNRLADFPRHLVALFPNLESLSLSHNRFARFPPWITLFSSLRRLETDPNPLVSLADPNRTRTRTGRAAVGEGDGEGDGEGEEERGVRVNAREMYPLVEDAVRRTVTQVSRAELLLSLRFHQHRRPTPRRLLGAPLRSAAAESGVAPPSRSLFSLSVELAQKSHPRLSSLPHGNTTDLDDNALSMIPPHLLEFVTTSYRCISCDRFVTMPDDSAWYVPPFWERVHFLHPGIGISLRDETRRQDRTRRRRQEERDDDDDEGDGGEGAEELVEYLEVGAVSGRGEPGGSKSATLEQRLLLAVLARREQGTLPPPDSRSRRFFSRADGSGGGGDGDENASSSRFFDSDYGCRSRRGHDDNDDADGEPAASTGSSSSAVTRTFVVGGRGPYGFGSRFCSLCAASHLGIRDAVLAKLERGEGDVVASWRCGCEMCEEETRVRGTASEGADERSKVVRWLRRYDAVRSTC